MRTLKELEERYFSPGTSRIVAFGNRVCATLLEPFQEAQDECVDERPGICSSPTYGLRPVLVASYDHYFVHDIRPEGLRCALRETRQRNDVRCRTKLIFVDSRLEVELHAHLLGQLQMHRPSLVAHPGFRFFGAFRGEQLWTASFSLHRYSDPPLSVG